jgi:hypothetical protein
MNKEKRNELNNNVAGCSNEFWEHQHTFFCSGRVVDKKANLFAFCTQQFWSYHLFLLSPNANPAIFLEQTELEKEVELSEFMKSTIDLYDEKKEYKFKLHYYKHYLGEPKLIIDGGEEIC